MGTRGGPRSEIVGRVEELAALDAALDDSLGGLGRLVLLAGEAGIGKTRLALEIARRAEAEGAVALLGRAWDEGGAPTAWTFVELLREARAHPALAPAHPVIDDALRALGAATDPASRFAAFDGAARALAEAARAAPLVLILDDLHWADAATLVLAKLCVRALARARALIVGTYREDEARAPEPARLLAELAREGSVLAPRPLAGEEVAVLVARGGLAGAWTPRVLERSGGNPFFVEQTVRWIAAEGVGVEEAALPVPAGARAIVARRLERLAPSARRLVEVAAAIGAEPDRALLAEVCPDLAPDLTAAVEHGVLSADAGRIAFAHDLLREAALATAVDRPGVHAAIAAALERLGGTPAELARHLAAAGDPRAPEVAADAGGARRATRRRRGRPRSCSGSFCAALRERRADGRGGRARGRARRGAAPRRPHDRGLRAVRGGRAARAPRRRAGPRRARGPRVRIGGAHRPRGSDARGAARGRARDGRGSRAPRDARGAARRRDAAVADARGPARARAAGDRRRARARRPSAPRARPRPRAPGLSSPRRRHRARRARPRGPRARRSAR
ncbi:MAG: AAA family ATPase [Sandaracinaceae bacterium]|nr:AAA family ATPase [Sandaracinaceae bacterium]